MLVVVAVVAQATEPSTTIVKIEGRKYYCHKVVKGDTFYSIAHVYGISEAELTKHNSGITAATLKAGSNLLIPYKELPESKSSVPVVQSDDEYRTHIISRGETLYSIAKRYKISVATLEADNPTIDYTQLKEGDELRIRRSEEGYTSSRRIERERKEREARLAEEAAQGGEHVVLPGETVYTLSRRYKISEQEFMQINALNSTSDLKAGMVVRTVAGGVETVEPATEESRKEAEEPLREILDPESAHAEMVEMMDSGAEAEVNPVSVKFLPLAAHHTLNMALMLPFHVNGKINPNYVDLYRGVLMAMDDLKAEGYNISLSVFDTMNSASRISDIVNYEDGLLDAQLIIGPVYEGELRYVLAHAEANDIPVVSPLADVKALSSPVLFQMQADVDSKYDKLDNIFDGEREVVVVYGSTNDEEYISELKARATNAPIHTLNFVFDRESFFYKRNADGSNGEEVLIEDFMRTPAPKAYIIGAQTPTEIDRILTTLSSMKASIEARSLSMGDYVVVGNRRWIQQRSIGYEAFFRNNVLFTVPYHAKRSNEVIRLFDARYISTFGALPTMYSYRGYDAAMIFCRKMFTGIDHTLFDEQFMPLTTPYKFIFKDGIYINTQWIKEHYRGNFSIDVE